MTVLRVKLRRAPSETLRRNSFWCFRCCSPTTTLHPFQTDTLFFSNSTARSQQRKGEGEKERESVGKRRMFTHQKALFCNCGNRVVHLMMPVCLKQHVTHFSWALTYLQGSLLWCGVSTVWCLLGQQHFSSWRTKLLPIREYITALLPQMAISLCFRPQLHCVDCTGKAIYTIRQFVVCKLWLVPTAGYSLNPIKDFKIEGTV